MDLGLTISAKPEGLNGNIVFIRVKIVYNIQRDFFDTAFIKCFQKK